MRAFDPFRSQIRDVLLTAWDPHDAARNPAAHGAYDSYVDPLAELLLAGVEDVTIAFFLRDRERESMCFPGAGLQRLRGVAQKLCAIPRPPPPPPG